LRRSFACRAGPRTRPDRTFPSTRWPIGIDPTARAGGGATRRPELLNPAGILQGGVAALLAELAAQRFLEAAGGRRLVISGFDVRYVTMGRVGPFEAVVTPIGADNAVVHLLDRGADDAIVTHNLISFVAV
jgi:acyl-coenzyme A thioesterase PaaI-like protein